MKCPWQISGARSPRRKHPGMMTGANPIAGPGFAFSRSGRGVFRRWLVHLGAGVGVPVLMAMLLALLLVGVIYDVGPFAKRTVVGTEEALSRASPLPEGEARPRRGKSTRSGAGGE